MKSRRTQAILELLRDGRDEKLAQSVMRLFGASSIDECIQTYAALGNAESAQLDDVVKRVTEDVSSAFSLRVDNKVAE